MGKIIVAGIGPGSKEDITPAVLEAVRAADAIVGYKYYFQFIQEYVHAICVAVGHNQKEVFTCHRLHRAIGVAILPNVVTGYGWPNALAAPAILGFVDSPESCFVLKHQPDLFPCILYTKFFFYTGFNFFEASIVSSSAFFGCFWRGITFRHSCLARSM